MAKGKLVGYRRVSTVDQKTDRQLEDMELDRVFEDKVSGATVKRPGLEQCLEYLREDDTLVVHSIDRLARSLGDLERMVQELNDRGVTIRFVKEGLVFGVGDESPMARLQLQMMGAFAQFERSLIKERQREGIAAAKAKGNSAGVPPCPRIKCRRYTAGLRPGNTRRPWPRSTVSAPRPCTPP